MEGALRGEVREQRILTYPVCLLSITPDYARLIGPQSAAARQPLEGHGWAFGAMFTPCAARAVLGPDRGIPVDRFVELGEVPLLAGLVPQVRAAMAADPAGEAGHRIARRLLEDRFSAVEPPAGEAVLINQVVRRVEEDPDITTVSALCDASGLQERMLQRLCARFLGLTPRWLIRQRRLQEAGQLLRHAPGPLSDVALRLGYADQAHFSRDFRRATGWTPGEFAALAGSVPDSTGHHSGVPPTPASAR